MTVPEGATFVIPRALIGGLNVGGVLVGLDTSGTAVAHFYQPAPPPSDVPSHPPVLIAKIVAESFTKGRWSLTGMVSDWHARGDRWATPVFRHWDVLRGAWRLRRYDGNDLMAWGQEWSVTESEAATFPADGLNPEEVIEERLQRLLIDDPPRP